MTSPNLVYEGCGFFRQRLVLATLSGKRVRIQAIRSAEDEPGLRGERHSAPLARRLAASCYAVESVVFLTQMEAKKGEKTVAINAFFSGKF